MSNTVTKIWDGAQLVIGVLFVAWIAWMVVLMVNEMVTVMTWGWLWPW